MSSGRVYTEMRGENKSESHNLMPCCAVRGHAVRGVQLPGRCICQEAAMYWLHWASKKSKEKQRSKQHTQSCAPGACTAVRV